MVFCTKKYCGLQIWENGRKKYWQSKGVATYSYSHNNVAHQYVMSDIIMTTIITGMRNFIEKHIGDTLLSCRLNCAIKIELQIVSIKGSRCQHGKVWKVLGSIVLKHFKAYRQGFFLPCHSRRKLVWGMRTVFLRRRLTFIQNTRKDGNMQTK